MTDLLKIIEEWGFKDPDPNKTLGELGLDAFDILDLEMELDREDLHENTVLKDLLEVKRTIKPTIRETLEFIHHKTEEIVAIIGDTGRHSMEHQKDLDAIDIINTDIRNKIGELIDVF